ncbi:diguanylate cyclase [Edaphobacter sp. HDX4]|uniref:sensor domain-containing diguanylate cyclase n=1 Tax=Edaphobacter sp. HDX4 TaxID=2794064 RepID=UPI002FE5FC01
MARRLPALNTSIWLILLAAVGCIAFTAGGGIFLFRNTRNLEDAGRWVQHTQQVQLSLQSASALTQRIETGTRMFKLTQDEDHLIDAQKGAIQFGTGITHLHSLTSDNPGQVSNLGELDKCSSALVLSLSKDPPALIEANAYLLRCRRILSLMENEERELLARRVEVTHQRSQVSIVTEMILGVVGFAVLITLFALLLRDAIVRNRIALLSEKTNLELNESIQRLTEYARDSQLLSIARDDLQLCTDQQQVYRSAASRFAELLPGSNGALCIINSSRNMVENVANWNSSQSAPRISDIFHPDSCCGLRSGQLRWYAPVASHIQCDHFVGPNPECYLCVPLVAHGETIGILYIDCPDESVRQIVEARTGGIRQLVQLTAMALASLQMRKKLEHQSVRDGLTGLFNRHFLEIALTRELARATRRKGSLAVLMIDVDHFKRLNDQFGHAAGDAVLKEVARIFSSSVRTEDLVCRYGGEEFTIILPDITLEAAFNRAEVIRKAVANLRSELDNELYSAVTISVGGALFPTNGQTSETLLRQADAALYRAKHEGRNKVVME